MVINADAGLVVTIAEMVWPAVSFIFINCAVVETRGARFGADPQRAVFIGLQREDASDGQCRIVDGLCSCVRQILRDRFQCQTTLRRRAFAQSRARDRKAGRETM